MVGLLIAGSVGAVLVAYVADRVLKARTQARRLAAMHDRLAAATRRAEEQHAEREASAQASAALTSVMPAIERPPLSLPGLPSHPARPAAGRERGNHSGARDQRSAHRGASPGAPARRPPGPHGAAAHSGPHPSGRAGQDEPHRR